MGKFNETASIPNSLANHPELTSNYEGGMAFRVRAKNRLYLRTASCLMNESKFYKEQNEDGEITSENQDKLLLQDLKLVADTDPEFILKLAAYARNSLFLRSVPTVLLVEASLIDKCKPFVRGYAPRIIKRADEITEAVAYLHSKIGDIGNKKSTGSMPACLKKGLADCFHWFDEYQFAKYDRNGTVKFRDVMRLVHPRPLKDEEEKLFKDIMERTLPTPKTWETIISTKGSTKENWAQAIPKMGYMALLRNLRNILKMELPLNEVCAKISDKQQVIKSKQLPFRFYSAYRTIKTSGLSNCQNVMDALEIAMDHSVENVPTLEGKTLVMIDLSGSMDQHLSGKSEVTLKQTASVLGAIVSKVCNDCDIVAFGGTWKLLPIGKRDGVLSITERILETNVGCATEAAATLKDVTSKGTSYDRIILLSDMQCYGKDNFAEVFLHYKASIGKKVKLYSIDLAGYGTTQTPEDEPNTLLLAGFSERIFQFIRIFESDKIEALRIIEDLPWGNPNDQENADE